MIMPTINGMNAEQYGCLVGYRQSELIETIEHRPSGRTIHLKKHPESLDYYTAISGYGIAKDTVSKNKRQTLRHAIRIANDLTRKV